MAITFGEAPHFRDSAGHALNEAVPAVKMRPRTKAKCSDKDMIELVNFSCYSLDCDYSFGTVVYRPNEIVPNKP